MENANSKDYLEKIKIQVIENLKKTAHAPSVQMMDVPRTTMTGGTEEDEAELDDLDEDENKDVRNTKRQWDQHISRDDELDESDDEEMNASNGISHSEKPKRRNIMDYQNANAVEDIEMDSGVATPDVLPEIETAATAEITQANAQVNANIMEAKGRGLEVAGEAGEIGPSNAPSRARSVEQALDREVEMTDSPAVDAEPAVIAESESNQAEKIPSPSANGDHLQGTSAEIAEKDEVLPDAASKDEEQKIVGHTEVDQASVKQEEQEKKDATMVADEAATEVALKDQARVD